MDEYRDREAVARYARMITEATTRPWTIMEICGGQTHAIIKYGIDQLLPETITLLHGPGCPVCVTSVALIDKGIQLASRKEIIFCSFGDMLRVPGSNKDLLSVKADGGDVRTVYSPLDAVKIARDNPSRQVVFSAQFQPPGSASPGAAGDRSHPFVAGMHGAGISRRRPRLRGDGIRRL